MRVKDVKNQHIHCPAILKKMGLEKSYTEFCRMEIEREKHKRIIYKLNPPHYAVKAYKIILYYCEEDLFSISGEDPFGRREVYEKSTLLDTFGMSKEELSKFH